jgi:hypothetical protein
MPSKTSLAEYWKVSSISLYGRAGFVAGLADLVSQVILLPHSLFSKLIPLIFSPPPCRYPCFSESESTCVDVWMAFRPPSNCDMEDLTRVRDFLFMRKQSLFHGSPSPPHATATASSTTPYDDIYYDPIARSVLDDAEEVLVGARLEYWEDAVGDQNTTEQLSTPLPNSINPTINVPCAIYTCKSPHQSRNSLMQFESESHDEHDQFEEMSATPACISPGDLICITEQGFDFPHLAQVSKQWYQVIKVDLLFCRVLVRMSFGPSASAWGGCERQTQTPVLSSKESSPPHWIHVSRLWNVLVSSIIPSESDTDTTIRLRQLIHVLIMSLLIVDCVV